MPPILAEQDEIPIPKFLQRQSTASPEMFCRFENKKNMQPSIDNSNLMTFKTLSNMNLTHFKFYNLKIVNLSLLAALLISSVLSICQGLSGVA